jgi:hypothetical protein
MSIVVAVAVAAAHTPARANALEPLPTLVISAHSHQGGPDAAVEREVRAALAQIDRVDLMAPPPLDFEAVQLAIDCTDESARCLRQVAERMDARVLVVPVVERANGTVVLRVLYYDAEGAEAPRTLEIEGRGDKVDGVLLARLPKLLRELFGEPAEPGEPAPTEIHPDLQPLPAPDPIKDGEPEARGPSLIAPLLIGAGGLGAVAAGLAFGVMMKNTQDDYATRSITTEMQAELAEEQRQRGEDQAMAATILLGVGAAAVVTAGIWLALVSGGEDQPAQAALVPAIGPRSAGVSLVGTWEAGR